MALHDSHYNKPKKSSKNSNTFTPIEFIRMNVTESDKPEIERLTKWLDEQSLDPLALLTQNGYKVSVRYNPDDESYMCSITGTENSVNANMCVTSYAGSVSEVLVISVFKAYNGKNWVVWDANPTTSRWG